MRTFVTALLAGQVISDQVLGNNFNDASPNNTLGIKDSGAGVRESLGINYEGITNAQEHVTADVAKDTKPEVTKVRLGDLRERFLAHKLNPEEREFVDALRENYIAVGRVMRVGGRLTKAQDEAMDLLNKLMDAQEFTQPLIRDAQGRLSLGESTKVVKENSDDELIELKVPSEKKPEDRSR